MKRELKAQPHISFPLGALVVSRLIPMKRELKDPLKYRSTLEAQVFQD